MKIAIAIPARYASTRFPGKPLVEIDGQSMLSRVVKLARKVAKPFEDIDIFVATEDERIAEHAQKIGVECVMTSDLCESGSDRTLEAIKVREDNGIEPPDYVINLQGDAPFTPPNVLKAMIKAIEENPHAQVLTPVHRLSWNDLDRLRESKKDTPFSGTTAIVNNEGYAMWFSKNIIPAIRKEASLREKSSISPVYQHMGLYGFQLKFLKHFCACLPGTYEQLEGLEQLRMLENGIKITAVEIDDIKEGVIQSGIDTPEDVARVERLLASQKQKKQEKKAS